MCRVRLACFICNRQREPHLQIRQGVLPLPSSSSSSSKAPAAASLRAACNRAWKTAPTASWALPDTTPPEPCLHPRQTSLLKAAKFWAHAPDQCSNTVSLLDYHASMIYSSLGDHASLDMSTFGDHVSTQWVSNDAAPIAGTTIAGSRGQQTCSATGPVW